MLILYVKQLYNYIILKKLYFTQKEYIEKDKYIEI